MFLDPDQCYRALRTHDARFDGRFFVGVGTTGIYCRPVCTAKTPLERNCSLLPERGGRRGARLPALPALPAGARARLCRGGCQSPPRAGGRGADRGRAPGGGEPSRSRRRARRHRPPPAPRLPAGVRRLARRLRADAAAAPRQAPAHRHGDARARRGDGERLREPAPLQRSLPHALPDDARRAAPGRAARAPERTGFPSTSPTGRPTTGRPCSPSSSGARSRASRRSMAGATGARCGSSARAGSTPAGSRSRPRRASRRCASRRARRSRAPSRRCSRA